MYLRPPGWLEQDTRKVLAAAVGREANRVAQEMLDWVAAEREFQQEVESIDQEYGIDILN